MKLTVENYCVVETDDETAILLMLESLLCHLNLPGDYTATSKYLFERLETESSIVFSDLLITLS